MLGQSMSSRYRIDARLGVGPFGTAYKAWQTAEERHVVLQILRPSGNEQKDDENYLRIMQKVSEVDSEWVLAVRDFGRTDEGQFFVATDFAEGMPVDRIVANDGPMEWQRAAAICKSVAKSLSAAHAAGVVHAGLTARAVLVESQGEDDFVKVRDFGLARLLAEPGVDDLAIEATDPALRDLMAGMGPERAVPGGVEPRSDLYGLGALLYHLVRGRSLSTEGRQTDSDDGERAPFMAADEADLHGLDDALADVIYGLLAADPNERIQSAEEAVEALTRLTGTPEREGRITPRDVRVKAYTDDPERRRPRPTLPEAGFKSGAAEPKPFAGTTRLEFGTIPTLTRRDTDSLRRGVGLPSLQGAAAVQEGGSERHAETSHWVPGRFADKDAEVEASEEDEPPPKPDSGWRGPPATSLPPWRRTASEPTMRGAAVGRGWTSTAPARGGANAVAGASQPADDAYDDDSPTTEIEVAPHATDSAGSAEAASTAEAEPEAARPSWMNPPAARRQPSDQLPPWQRPRDEEVAAEEQQADVLPPIADKRPAAEPSPEAQPAQPAQRAFKSSQHREMPSNVSVSASGAFLPWRDSGGIKPEDPARDLSDSQIMTHLEVTEPEGEEEGEAEADDDGGGTVRSIEDILAVDRFFDGDAKPDERKTTGRKKRASSGFMAEVAPTGGFWRTEQGRWTVRIVLALFLFAGVLYLAVWHGRRPASTAKSTTPAVAATTAPPASTETGTAAVPPPAMAVAATGVAAAETTEGGVDEPGESVGAPTAGTAIDAPAPAAATVEKERPVPEHMVRIASGNYPLGCLATHDGCPADATPMHRTPLPAFAIMEREVNTSEYRRCEADGACPAAGTGFQCNRTRARSGRHPINCVSWQAADAYCRFRGWRLPSEAEWEASARGQQQKVYPWGSEWPSCGHTVLRTFSGDGCGKGGTSPAGEHPGDRSWAGVHGLGGNVSEWVAGDHVAYPGAPAIKGPARKVWRGGNLFMDARSMVPVYHRGTAPGEARRPDIGFRCAVDL